MSTENHRLLTHVHTSCLSTKVLLTYVSNLRWYVSIIPPPPPHAEAVIIAILLLAMPPSAQRRRILNKGIDDDRPLYALLRRPSLVLAFLVMLVVSFAGIWMYQLFFVAFGSLESSPRVQVLEPGPLPAREKKLSGRPPIQARGGDVVAAAEDDPPNKSNENKDIRNGNVNNVISEPISASHGGDGGGGGFAHFNSIAQDLAALEDPADVLGRLEGDDPFGTRKFDSELLQRETDLGRVLSIDEMRQLFPCPDNERRITLPDARMEQKARDFRNAKRGTFLFFQHLRKVSTFIVPSHSLGPICIRGRYITSLPL